MAKKEITNSELAAKIDKLAAATDSKIDKLDGKIDKLAVAMKEGFDEVDEKFEIVDKRLGALEFKFDDLKKDFRQLQSAVDGYAHQANTYFMEMAAMGNKLSRHERWIEKIAEKTGVKLDY